MLVQQSLINQNNAVDLAKLANISDRTKNAAQIFIAMIPILLIYPLLQKHFAKGLITGKCQGIIRQPSGNGRRLPEGSHCVYFKEEIMYCWNDFKHETPDWFRDAKFGLFFHWGPYSVAEFGNEWYSRNIYDKGHEARAYHEKTFGNTADFGYKDLIPLFTGEHFDPEQWAGLVELSGARYAGPVTEHADNYSLWNSQINPINSVKTGPHRDVVGECLEAFRKRDIRCLATFHHQWLWGWYMGTDMEADVYRPENELYYSRILPLETNRYIPAMRPDREFCAQWRDKVLEVLWKYEPDAVYFDSRANLIPDMYKQQVCEALYLRKDRRLPISSLTSRREPLW